jgi:hypothetical protein
MVDNKLSPIGHKPPHLNPRIMGMQPCRMTGVTLHRMTRVAWRRMTWRTLQDIARVTLHRMTGVVLHGMPGVSLHCLVTGHPKVCPPRIPSFDFSELEAGRILLCAGAGLFRCSWLTVACLFIDLFIVFIHYCSWLDVAARCWRMRVHEQAGRLFPEGYWLDIRLPRSGNSNSHGARAVHQIITMIKWVRTIRLSIKNSLIQKGVGIAGVTRGTCVSSAAWKRIWHSVSAIWFYKVNPPTKSST